MFMKFIYHKVKNVTDCIRQKVYLARSLYDTKFIRHKVYTLQSSKLQILYVTKFIRHKVYNYKAYNTEI
jgi:hypothetical protein